MNHNNTKTTPKNPLSFMRLDFHYFPLQRKHRTKTSGPVNGLPAKASTSAAELKQQQPNLCIVFSFFKFSSFSMRQWKEIIPQCFISRRSTLSCNHTPTKDTFLPKSCHFLNAIKFQTVAFIGAEQLVFSQKIFFTKVSSAGSGTLFLNSWETLLGNVGEQQATEVLAKMKEFCVQCMDEIQAEIQLRAGLKWILTIECLHSTRTREAL